MQQIKQTKIKHAKKSKEFLPTRSRDEKSLQVHTKKKNELIVKKRA